MVLLALICFYFICFGPARSTSDCFLAFFSRRTPSAKGPFLVFLKQRSVCFSSWLPSPCAYFLLFIEWFFKNTNKGPLAPFCHEGANKIRASASFPFLARLACRLLASSPALLFLEKQCAPASLPVIRRTPCICFQYKSRQKSPRTASLSAFGEGESLCSPTLTQLTRLLLLSLFVEHKEISCCYL